MRIKNMKMTSKEKQRKLRRIKRARNWIGLISCMKEGCYDDERYYSKEDFHKELERFYKHIDCTILYWALSAYKDEVKNTKVNNKEE